MVLGSGLVWGGDEGKKSGVMGTYLVCAVFVGIWESRWQRCEHSKRLVIVRGRRPVTTHQAAVFKQILLKC